MALSAEDIRSIAEAFRHARQSARAMPGYPGALPETLEQAYRVQDYAIGAWDDEVAGWKIGGIPVDLRPRFGGADRLAGPVFSRSIINSRPGGVTPYPVFDGGFAAVEAEFVLRIGRDCGPGECPPAQAAGLVDAVFLGIETAGSPLATINDLGPCVIISDFGNNHGLIIGPQLADWRAPGFGKTPVWTTVDGARVGSGNPDSLTGGPVGSLVFLLEVLAQRGLSLKQGDLVTTGAVTGVHVVAPGAVSRVEIPGRAAIDALAVPDTGRVEAQPSSRLHRPGRSAE